MAAFALSVPVLGSASSSFAGVAVKPTARTAARPTLQLARAAARAEAKPGKVFEAHSDRSVSRRSFNAALAAFAGSLLVAAEPALAGPPKKKQLVFKTTESGLQIADVQVGSGMSPNPGDRLVVHFTAKLSNGTTFASSRDSDSPASGTTPFGFTLGANRVIKGWFVRHLALSFSTDPRGPLAMGFSTYREEGVMGMKVGGRRKLIIPPELAYGEQGNTTLRVPPNETITCDIELLSVKRSGSSGIRAGPLVEG
eukprot:tig00020927_g15979.t1